MGRDDTITRMDFDTEWLYHHRARDLQRARPKDWPAFYCAYMVVLADSWRRRKRVTLADAWPPAGTLPVTLAVAGRVLTDVGLLDHQGRVRKDAWDEWVVPVLARIDATRAAARKAANTRWAKVAADLQRQSDTPKRPTVRKGRNAPASATAIPKPSHTSDVDGASAPSTAAHALQQLPMDLTSDGLPHLTVPLVKAAEQLVGMTFGQAGAKVPTALDQLVERHGADQVSAMLAAVAETFNGTKPSWVQLVYGTRNALEPIPGSAATTKAASAVAEQANARRAARGQVRHMAYLRGEITEAQLQQLAASDRLPGEDA